MTFWPSYPNFFILCCILKGTFLHKRKIDVFTGQLEILVTSLNIIVIGQQLVNDL